MKNLAQLVLIWCLDAAKMLECRFRSRLLAACPLNSRRAGSPASFSVVTLWICTDHVHEDQSTCKTAFQLSRNGFCRRDYKCMPKMNIIPLLIPICGS